MTFVMLVDALFQSTPPVKAATIGTNVEYGEVVISIHAAREGGDPTNLATFCLTAAFQSTPPVKAATERASCGVQPSLFQSTPPVKAATREADVTLADYKYFNPRRP